MEKQRLMYFVFGTPDECHMGQGGGGYVCRGSAGARGNGLGNAVLNRVAL